MLKLKSSNVKKVRHGGDWDLTFEDKVYKTVKAKEIYDLISENAFMNNEPGILNVDHVNKANNGWWAFDINEVNPCGEIVMGPYNVCCLSAINLSKFVKNKFTDEAEFDFERFAEVTQLGVRFLDDVLSVAEYPLDKIKDNAVNWRRIGLGFTGFGNVFKYLRMG